MKKPSSKTSNTNVGAERLHKFIASCGVCSRRKAEELIAEGRVQVNGKIIQEQGTKVTPEDTVRVDGGVIHQPKLYYVLMNKPKGVVTTMSDPQRRRTVMDYLPDLGANLKPVGRLDKDTEGLLLFTNDGELASRLTHPSHKVDKTYIADVLGTVDERIARKLAMGVILDDRKTKPAVVKILGNTSKTTRLKITIHEGRKRQVRRMCEVVGHPVENLKRLSVGQLVLKGIAAGQCRVLGMREVEKLRKSVGLSN